MFLRFISACCLFVLLVQPAARAQDVSEPQDASELIVRMSSMEQQIRQMTGQIEQLEYENRQLKEKLRRFEGAPSPTSSTGPAPSVFPHNQETMVTTPSSEALASSPPPVKPDPEPRRDLFNPDEHPNAPGVPQPLGATQPSRPLMENERQQELKTARPLERTQGEMSSLKGDNNTPLKPIASNAPSVAATGSNDPQEDYEEAYTQFSRSNYREAEMGFRKFLQSHPRDERVPDAMYWLGETYLSTNKGREAGEQFLGLTKQYPASPKAPSALLKLGSSLVNIGAVDRGCAIFSEAARKYSKASQSFKDEIMREQRRAKCS
jgi:tol-pal system protein YbgF